MSTRPAPSLRIFPGNRKGTPAVMAGAFAFLLQILVWSFVAPAMAVGQIPSYCLLETDEAQGQDTPQKAGHQSDPCGYCLLAQSVGAGPAPADDAVGKPVSYILGVVSAESQTASHGWLLATLQPRGPPLKALL